MKQAQQNKDGNVLTRLDDAETIDKMVQKKQRENLIDLLNRKEAKQQQKSPQKKITVFLKVLLSLVMVFLLCQIELEDNYDWHVKLMVEKWLCFVQNFVESAFYRVVLLLEDIADSRLCQVF